MPQGLNEILKKYVEDVHMLYGDRLRIVILYGSYARGDFGQDSDIDIMIFEDDIQIMPIVKNVDHFNKWLRAYPFYYTVRKEGVDLYAA